MSADDARREIARLKTEQSRLRAENDELRRQLGLDQPRAPRRGRGSGPPDDDIERVLAWCAARVPARYRSEVRIECVRRGRSLTILELRPPWQPDLQGDEWSRMRIAQLRWDAGSGVWELYFADRNGRWWPYEQCAPTADIEAMLRELEDDPTAVFWG
jgi:hypothetical protein